MQRTFVLVSRLALQVVLGTAVARYLTGGADGPALILCVFACWPVTRLMAKLERACEATSRPPAG
jgi:hypothetical protein